jgi:hypothetical protein
MTKKKISALQLNLFANLIPDEKHETPVKYMTKKARILECIGDAESGYTCEEIVRKLRFRHQTVSARLNEMFNDGVIVQLVIDREPVFRKTSGRKKAVVWVLKRHKVA